MNKLTAIILFITAFAVRAQTVANTANVLHPIIKDRTKPAYAPTSLDRDPNEKASLQPSSPAARSYATASSQPAQPVEIVAHIDASLVASPISMIGTVTGIKGRLYVTNIGSQVVVPTVQFAVCDAKGFKIGATARTAPALAPNESEKIDVLATNADAADLKLMKLSAGTPR